MLAAVLVAAALAAAAVGAPAAVAGADICGFTGTTVNASDFKFHVLLTEVNEYNMYWNIIADADTGKATHICFGFTGTAAGWMGMGISESGSMIPSGVTVVASGSNGEPAVVSHRETKQKRPSGVMPTTSFTVIEEQAARVGGTFHLRYGRLVDADESFPVLFNKKQKIVFAQRSNAPGLNSPLNQLQEHDLQAGGHGQLEMNFFTGFAEKKEAPVGWIRITHGVFMFLAWGVIVPFMNVLGRYKIKTWWFNVHRAFQGVAALVFTLAGFALVFYFNQSTGLGHFNQKGIWGAHEIMGGTIIALALVQPALGVMADKMFDPQRHRVPVFPDGVHAVLGWILYLAGAINCILGVHLITDYALDSPWFISVMVWSLVVFAFILAVVGREAITNLLSHNQESNRGTRHVQRETDSLLG